MLRLFSHEFKQNMKALFIWSIAVGGLGFMCICLFTSMEGSMKELSESFSNMGMFSDAFGMSTLGIGTIAGYFATEVGTVHGLGSAMFIAVIATTILSKEEDGHTGEFLYSLPVSRVKAITAKILSILSCIIIFTAIACVFYELGFVFIKEQPDAGKFAFFMLSELLMNIEIAMICIAFSAFVKKNMLGTGLGIILLFYFFDLVGRVIPNLKDMLVLGPYSYANASEIFSGKTVGAAPYIIGAFVTILSVFLAYGRYTKKDLAS